SPAVLASVLGAHIAATQGDADKASAIAMGAEPVALAVPGANGVLLIDAGEAPAHVVLMGPDGPTLHAGDALSGRKLLDDALWNTPLEEAALSGAGAKGDNSLAVRARLLCAAQLA